MKIDVSVVIVSMNNIDELCNCLDSIWKYNFEIELEIIVVAFNFSQENIKKLRARYKRIVILETQGVKGFSENNNVGLQYVKGDFTLILNDDTYFFDDSIKRLYEFLKLNNNKFIVSPHILNVDRSTQFLGRPKLGPLGFLLLELKLHNILYKGNIRKGQYFKTYNISGACFMIKTSVFKELNFFDEDYFFTPEDIALSTLAVSKAYFPYVLKSASVIHKGSTTAKKIHQVTIPVAKQGVYIHMRKFYGATSEYFVRCSFLLIFIFKFFYWFCFKINKDEKRIMLMAYRNSINYSFSNEHPKSLFEKLYRI